MKRKYISQDPDSEQTSPAMQENQPCPNCGVSEGKHYPSCAQKNKPQHTAKQSGVTPTPWSVHYEDSTKKVVHSVVGDEHEIIETDSGVYGPNKADAEFIVRAVNSHEKFVAAYEALERGEVQKAGFLMREAIAQAEGKS